MESRSRASGYAAATAAASPPRPVNLRRHPAGGDGEGKTAGKASGFLAVKRGLPSQRRRQADSSRCRKTASGGRLQQRVEPGFPRGRVRPNVYVISQPPLPPSLLGAAPGVAEPSPFTLRISPRSLATLKKSEAREWG